MSKRKLILSKSFEKSYRKFIAKKPSLKPMDISLVPVGMIAELFFL